MAGAERKRSGRLEAARRLALVVGSVELAAAPIWAVAGAGFYGSPLGEVSGEGWWVIGLLFVLAGPLGLLPAALLAKRWPRGCGRALVAGGSAAVVLALDPWGLAWAAWHLSVDVAPGVVGIALSTLALGALLVTLERRPRAWWEVIGIAFVSFQAASVYPMTIGMRESARPWRTDHPIDFLAFTADGSTLVAGGHSNRVGAPAASLSRIDARTGESATLAFGTEQHTLAPDSAWLVARDDAETLAWDTANWTSRRLADRARAIAVARDGRVALRTRERIVWIDGHSGEERASVSFETEVSWLAISADSRMLAIGGYSAEEPVQLWQIETGALRTLPLAPGPLVLSGQWSPDGRVLAFLVETKEGEKSRLSVRLWDVAGDREIALLPEAAPDRRRWFSPAGVLLTERVEQPVPGEPPTLVSTLWTPDGNKLASFPGGGGAWCQDATLVLPGARWRPAPGGSRGRASWPIERRAGDGRLLGDVGSVEFVPLLISCAPDSRAVAVVAGGEFLHGAERGRVVILRAE